MFEQISKLLKKTKKRNSMDLVSFKVEITINGTKEKILNIVVLHGLSDEKKVSNLIFKRIENFVNIGDKIEYKVLEKNII